jgi:hypothetical protein
MSKILRLFTFSPVLLASIAFAEVPRTQPDLALQQLKSQLGFYESVTYATDHGYIRASACEAHPTLGAMGFHYVRPDLLGLTAPVNGRVNGTGTYTSVEPPAILLYMPDEHGELQLVGVEILVFAAAWDAANNHPPMYRGREFNYMEDDPSTARDEAHGFMPHYDLHIWFAHNPSGLYAQWNPSLSCGAAAEAH